uniref:glycogen synthase n=1 Tax=Baileyella intestinalis TaxID=2606709 RepID=UPI003A8C3BF3
EETKETETKVSGKKTAGTKASSKKKAAASKTGTSTKRKTASRSKSTASGKTTKMSPARKAAPKEAKLKVLFATSECVPFASTGGLGEVAGSLPAALVNSGVDCRVIMPLYEKVPQSVRDKMVFMGTGTVPVAWRRQYLGLFEMKQNNVTYYFVDNEYYFKRAGLYGYYDDGERFSYFSRAVFEAMEIAGFYPDIIHCNDWQTALVPVFQNSLVRREYLKTVFTIHNIEYQGQYSTDALDSIIGLPNSENHVLEYGDCINLMKGGLECANAITTVSPTYAREIFDPANSFGLEPIISKNGGKISGIVNGINTQLYDSAKDPYTAAHYSSSDLSGKYECRRALQSAVGLPEKDVPVITMISRLVPPKGIDLVMEIMDSLLASRDIQFIILGTGESHYEDFFRGLQERHQDKVRALIQFNAPLSHMVYAGGSILLVPSRSEPCGLTQMIGCRYGNIPVVRQTGGLADTITDCTLGDGSGFVFSQFTGEDLYNGVTNALDRWYQRDDWEALMKHDMDLDFSWNASAAEYLKLYKQVISE